ncbi:hypothetical protein [Pseudarthrobacter sp. YALA5]|uniref:hypothetical protein n=1 Tax=Pseudarthrobacter sp. DSP2-3-2b1 TaxID=2804661 RepID=UPI00103FFECE
MSGDLGAAGMAACMSRAYEVLQLAGRVARCTEQVESIGFSFREVQLLDWQSPAGRAYRNSVALQEVALGRARVRLHDAATAVHRHAREVESTAGTTAGRY